MANNSFKYLSEIEILDSTNCVESISKMKIIKSAFHDMIQNKKISIFDEIMSLDLKIYKNNEIWDYDTAYSYIKNLISDYEKVEFLPFDLLVINGKYVTIKFTESLYPKNEPVIKHKFISIFEIQDQKIKNIWELSVKQQSDDDFLPVLTQKSETAYLNDH